MHSAFAFLNRRLHSALQGQTRKVVRCYSADAASEFNIQSLGGANAGIVQMTFNRPQTKNALGRNVIGRFEEAIKTIAFDRSARVVVIGSDVKGAFCSGADLKERATMKVHEVGPFVARLRGLLGDLERLPQPVICALDGIALGGGLEIALACDIRVASNDAKMGLVETRIANVPGGGGTQRLSRAVGLAKAKELIFTAKVINGMEAERIGLVQRCFEQNSDGNAALLGALALAREITPNGPFAVKAAKFAVDRGYHVNLASGLAIEELAYNTNVPTKDRLEGIAAFREKRKPNFTGE